MQISAPYYIALLILTLICFYKGFAKIRKKEGITSFFRVLFVLFFALCIASSYGIYKQHMAISALEKHIRVYPKMTVEMYSPKLGGGYGQYWIFKSEDRPQEILDYYEQSKHRQGWVKKTSRPLILQKQGVVLRITTEKDGEGSLVNYAIRQFSS